jgi:hypothetical protein
MPNRVLSNFLLPLTCGMAIGTCVIVIVRLGEIVGLLTKMGAR